MADRRFSVDTKRNARNIENKKTIKEHKSFEIRIDYKFVDEEIVVLVFKKINNSKLSKCS